MTYSSKRRFHAGSSLGAGSERRRTTGGAAGGRGPGVGVGGFGRETWRPGPNVKGDCELRAGSPEADRHRWKGYLWMSNVALRTWF